MVALPTAFTTAIAATMWPLRDIALAEPRPPFTLRWWRRCGATLPSAKCRRWGLGGGVAEVAIGGEQIPVLVAAVQQIEDDRLRHDRHQRAADREAATWARNAACTPRRRRARNTEPPESTIASTAWIDISGPAWRCRGCRGRRRG